MGVFTTDASLVVRTWDAWLAKVTGIPADRARGRSLVALVPDLEQRGLLAPFERVLTGGGSEILAPAFHKYLLPCPPPEGAAIFDRMQQRVMIGPLREETRIVGTIVTVEDVTARIEHERALAARLIADNPQAARGEAPVDAHSALESIRSDDWQVRRGAVAALGTSNVVDVIAAALQSLREEHHDVNVLSSVIELLTSTELDVVQPLLGLLAHPDVDLKLQAALLLGQRGDARAVPALLAALGDPDENLRFHAIEALGQLRATAAIDALAALAESRDFFLAFPALEALARIGDPAVAPRLTGLMNDDLIRSAAADTLGRIGDEDVVVPLVDLLNQAASPTSVAAEAIARVHERYEARYQDGEHIAQLVRRTITATGVQNLIDALRQAEIPHLRAIATLLGWLDGRAVERALTRLLGEPSVRATVVESLVRHGEGVVDLLIEQLAAEDLETREAAVVGLGRIGDRRATRPILALIDRDPAMAVVASGALARIGDREAFEPLLAWVGHEDSAIRQAVVGALNSIGHPGMAERIGPMLDDPRPAVRESAVRIAGYFGQAGSADALFARVADPDPAVQRAAIDHLPYVEDERVMPTLIGLMRDPRASLRRAAVQALAKVDAPRADVPIVTALADDDAWVRYFASRAAGERRHLGAIDRLCQLAGADSAGHVRLAAIDALGAIGDPSVTPLLTGLAGSDEPELATAAVRALGVIGHGDAWAPLEAALRSPVDEVRIAATQAIARLADARGVSVLEWSAGADHSEAVAEAAIRALGLMAASDRLGAPAIKALTGLAGNSARRDFIIATLAAIPPARLDVLAQSLDDSRPGTRIVAIQALGRMRHAGASRWLSRTLDDGAAEVRLAAIAEVRHLGSRAMERKLVTLARADVEPAVRRAALAALRGAADDQS